uniref:Ribonuclease E n=1 Tax=Asparagopsis taxiformis TaxID=260499 RepID=A0A1C9CCB2_9FLOR|nr:ribonuclease E [Asparagopsis taxiformis]AOM65992.1 ribonuclease E [Asparagopsis taxiformis]
MVKKIVISRFNNIAAILQNHKIQEIIAINNKYQVNDIYLGTVQKIFSSINAAFVKLGEYGKSGFIHISDIKPLKKGRMVNHITDILSINQLVLVQIIKEPTLNKGPRLTANINLIGRYLILMPFSNTVCISHKIYDHSERVYLNALAMLLKPAIMGLFVRSSAQGITEEAILEDLRLLRDQWSFVQKSAITIKFPSLIYKDEDLVQRIVRDYYEDSVKKIIIDSQDGLLQVRYHLNKWQCISSYTNMKLQLYNKSECLLDQFQVKDTVSEALKPKIQLSSGGYIFIENNEALTVIDVNSGSFNKSENSKEAILRTNCYAAIEIAYQLKIRNINGVIIIDFIDMQSQRDQLQLLEHFSNLLKLDHAKPQIVQLSELGLVELTRRRRGQSLLELCRGKNHCYLNNIFNSINLSHSLQGRKDIVIHQKINLLFFNKKFFNSLTVVTKKDNSKRFIHVCTDNRINIVKPRANYIVPFLLYSRIIGT